MPCVSKTQPLLPDKCSSPKKVPQRQILSHLTSERPKFKPLDYCYQGPIHRCLTSNLLLLASCLLRNGVASKFISEDLVLMECGRFRPAVFKSRLLCNLGGRVLVTAYTDVIRRYCVIKTDKDGVRMFFLRPSNMAVFIGSRLLS